MAEEITEEQEQVMLQELSIAGISEDDFLEDVERLAEMLSELDGLDGDVEGLSPMEQNQVRGEALIDIVSALSKYDNLPVLRDYVLDIFDDVSLLDEFDNVYDDMAVASEKIDISEYDADLAEIKILYERALDMDDLSDEEKLEKYDEVLGRVRGLVFSATGRGDEDALTEQFARYLGMPDHVFPDKMAEYTQLKAQQISDLLDEAKNYTRADAKEALLARGNDAPSDDKISELYLDHKQSLLFEARSLDDAFRGNVLLDEDTRGLLEYQGGYTADGIDLQIEIIELEQEQLEMSMKRDTAVVEHATDAMPQIADVAVEPTEQPYVAGVQGASAFGLG